VLKFEKKSVAKRLIYRYLYREYSYLLEERERILD
jgi:hypothetical protein